MTRDEIAGLICDLRRLVEKRLRLKLSAQASLRLEHRLFEALIGEPANVLAMAEREARMQEVIDQHT